MSSNELNRPPRSLERALWERLERRDRALTRIRELLEPHVRESDVIARAWRIATNETVESATMISPAPEVRPRDG